jgi:hypothetical protein
MDMTKLLLLLIVLWSTTLDLHADTVIIHVDKDPPAMAKDEDEEKERNQRLASKWMFLGPTYFGVPSSHPGFKEKFGFELGLSLPVLRGIDLGAHWGSLFVDGEKANTSYTATFFVTKYKRGWFIGGQYWDKSPKDSFGYFGFMWRNFFFKVDLPKGRKASIEPQIGFGYRLRFFTY